MLEQIRAGEIPIDSIIEDNTRGLRPLAKQIHGDLSAATFANRRWSLRKGKWR